MLSKLLRVAKTNSKQPSSTNELIEDFTPKQKKQYHKLGVRLGKQCINLFYFTIDHLFPPANIKLKFIDRNGKPVITGGITQSRNMRSYRSNSSGMVYIYIKQPRKKRKRKKASRNQSYNQKGRACAIYLNRIRCTKLLSPSHRVHKIVVVYNHNASLVVPYKPYLKPKIWRQKIKSTIKVIYNLKRHRIKA